MEGLTEDEADQEAVTTEEPKFLSLEEILGMDTADLTAEKQGFFHSEKLGDIPYTAISYDDYKQAKKDCVTYDQDENGVIQTKVDDDKLMTKIVILAVDKDQRSNFTFANGALLKKIRCSYSGRRFIYTSSTWRNRKLRRSCTERFWLWK